MQNPISSEESDSENEIIKNKSPECEVHSEDDESENSTDEEKIQKKEFKIDLNEQDNEFISEARESLLRFKIQFLNFHFFYSSSFLFIYLFKS